MARFSTTERQTFKKCRRLWSWSGKSRLNLRPVEKNGALSFGSALHECLAAYHLTGTNPSIVFQSLPYVQNALDDDIELGIGMLDHYVCWNERQPKLKFMVAEYPFEVTIPGTDDIYSGIVDGVAEDESGRLWIVEHKGYRTLANDRQLNIDDQVVSYQWAISESLGIPITGVIHNQLLKKAPPSPRLLKSGRLSDNPPAGMTYDAYLAEVRKLGQDPNDYKDTLMTLYHKDNPYFKRTHIQRNTKALENVKHRIYLETRDMANPNLPLYPNITYECSRCPFYDPCVSVENGQNPDFLLNMLYTKGESLPSQEVI